MIVNAYEILEKNNKPVEYLTEETYFTKVKQGKNPYWLRSYNEHWTYMSKVSEFILAYRPKTILELGTMGMTFTNVSDVLDNDPNNVNPASTYGNIIITDASNTPYEINMEIVPDHYYDMVIALQCFEHFGDNQRIVYNEIKRIAKFAAISIPWKWNTPSDKIHHNINETHLKKWFDYPEFLVKEYILSMRKVMFFRYVI